MRIMVSFHGFNIRGKAEAVLRTGFLLTLHPSKGGVKGGQVPSGEPVERAIDRRAPLSADNGSSQPVTGLN